MDYTVFEDVRKVDHDRWLELRRTGIGGSDAGAIMGVHPYKGAFSVWADKRGKLPPAEDNEAMRQGRDLEDYVAKRFEQATGKKVRREYGMLRSKEHPWMVADLDRRVIGERAGLECKTSKDIYLKRYANGDFPMEYYCQCLHYLAVTGFDKWYLAVLVYGTELKIFEICREAAEDDIQALLKAEEFFWRQCMEGDVVPPADDLQSTSDSIKRVWPEGNGVAVCADQDMDEMLKSLAKAKREKKAAEAEIRKLENQIKARMGETEWIYGSEATAAWSVRSVKRKSWSKLQELYPDVDMDKITETYEERTFNLKEENDNGKAY